MTFRLHHGGPDFAAQFDALVNMNRDTDANLSATVAGILNDVRVRGDKALAELTRRFDGFDLDEQGWTVPLDACSAAYDALPPDLREALDLAACRIRDWHAEQKPGDKDGRDAQGIRMGARWTPVDAAGLYVPGGRAAYPSSVLMNALPAKVAGVQRLVVVTPTPGGELNELLLAALHIAEVDEVWRIGGAQAVAALAYGTGRIAPVDVVTGPGNAWVAEAKRQLFGTVGIDMVAGPSEIVVVADAQNDPAWIAADLLSQAEHDPTSQSILFTDDAAFADQVASEVGRQIEQLSTGPTARQSWKANGAIIVVEHFGAAMPMVNRLAPEHLQIAVEDPDSLFAQVRHAGSVFLGRHTPEAIGDYVAGPNHVLPTGRRARFSSGLSVLDFVKRTSFIALDPGSLAQLGPAAVAMAHAEGLPAHAKSVEVRLDALNRKRKSQ